MLLSFTMPFFFFYKYEKRNLQAQGKQNILFYVLYVLLKRRLISVDYRNDYKEVLFQYKLLVQALKTALGKENPQFILEKKGSMYKYPCNWKRRRGGRKPSLRDQDSLHPHPRVNCQAALCDHCLLVLLKSSFMHSPFHYPSVRALSSYSK